MKKWFVLLAACSAFILQGKEINNFLKDGFPVLIPSVQSVKWDKSQSFQLKATTIISAPASAKREAKLAGHMIYRRFKKFKNRSAKAGEKAHVRLYLTESGVPESPEGYTLEITPSGVEIKSRSEKGLFYGVHTFGNIVGNNPTTTLPGCRITDYPDMKIRGVFINLRYLRNQDAKRVADAIRALASLRYNTLVLEFADNLPMKKNPFTLRKYTLTKRSLDLIIRAAKESHCEIVPHLQVISHDRWLSTHPDYFEKITARDNTRAKASEWSSHACPNMPLTRELTTMTINETIRLLKPSSFHLALDEIMRSEWNICKHCPNGHSTEQLIDEIKYYTHLVADRGIAPWVYHDTFCWKDNSGGESALPLLPRNTHMNIWTYSAVPFRSYFDLFKPTGLPLVGVSHVKSLENIPAMAELSKEYGTAGVVLTYWGYLGGSFTKAYKIHNLAAAGTVIAAEYNWKLSRRDLHTLDYDPAWEMRRRLPIMKLSLHRPFGRYAQIPLAALCNAKIGADRNFPILDKAAVAKVASDLAAAPCNYKVNLTPDGKLAAVVLSDGRDGYSNKKVTIPVNRRCAGLSFLLMATRPLELLLSYRHNDRYKTPPVLNVKINYSDGTSKAFPLRYRLEINDWNSLTSGYLCRFVIRDNDMNKSNYAIYAYDWYNHRAGREITSIDITPAGKVKAAAALLALTAHYPGKKGADNEAMAKLPANLPEYNVKTKSMRPDVIAADFTRDLDKLKLSFGGKEIKVTESMVVDDPGSFSGKALEVEIPPFTGDRNRLILDIPVSGLKSIGAMGFSIRTDTPLRIGRSGAYFMNDDTLKHNVFFEYHSNSKDWQYCHIPYRETKVEAEAVTIDSLSTLRVSAWLVQGEKPMKFRFGPVAAYNQPGQLLVPPGATVVNQEK